MNLIWKLDLFQALLRGALTQQSAVILVCMAIDRYVCMLHPHHYHKHTSKKVRSFCHVALLFFFLLSNDVLECSLFFMILVVFDLVLQEWSRPIVLNRAFTSVLYFDGWIGIMLWKMRSRKLNNNICNDFYCIYVQCMVAHIFILIFHFVSTCTRAVKFLFRCLIRDLLLKVMEKWRLTHWWNNIIKNIKDF